MRPRLRLTDLFCGAGGCSVGFARAGFNVSGVDHEPHPDYPYSMLIQDAMTWLDRLVRGKERDPDVVSASPPCPRYSLATQVRGTSEDHPDLIGPVRDLLTAWGGAYVIENVPGAPLRDPVELCGAMFGLRTYRHRLFESNLPLYAPPHPPHVAKTTKMGRPPVDGEFMHVVGNFSGVQQARAAMGIGWMTRDDLRDAIPPAYTEHIGRRLVAHLEAAA